MSEWIATRDELPKNGIPVLVVYMGRVQNVSYMLDVDRWVACDSGEPDDMPLALASHWMRLPDPPAE